MAVPAYTTDLVDWIADSDTTAWIEFTGMTGGALPDEADTESALQGTNTVSQATNATTLFSMGRILGASVTIATNDVFLVWHGHGVATALASYASGGLRLVAATTAGDWKAWAVGGNDTPPFPYGKWVNNPIDPSITGEFTLGTPPAALTFFGVGSAGILTAAVAKGQPHVTDIIRYGRAEARINGGETANFAVFSGFAAANDATSARWGLIQATDGGYLWKGLMILGYTSLVDFRDSNKTIFVQDTRKVYSTFNKIEIRQATSRVDWTGINFVCLSPSSTASKGNFEMINAADVNIDGCNFTDMNTFIFLSSGAAINTKFLRCNTITGNGGLFTATSILASTVAANTSALIWDVNTDPDGKLDNMTYSKGTAAHHAIEFGTTSPLTMTLRGIDFTGFSASQNVDGSIFHIKRTTGTVTINLVGCSSDVSFATSYRTDGATVAIVQNPVTFSVTVKDLETSAVIENARVMVPVTSNANFPYQASVTITSSGTTTATVAHATHGRATGDNILIAGANQDAYNGAFQITVTGAGTYTYTMPDTAADATGTITATMVLLNGLTNASGVISDTRTYSAAQTVSGWVRRHTYGPSYTSATWTESTSTLTKTGAFTGFSGTFLLTITAGTNMTPGIYLATYVNANDVTLPGGAGSADSSNVAFTIGAKPLYRQAPVAEEISSSNGKSVTVFLQPDE